MNDDLDVVESSIANNLRGFGVEALELGHSEVGSIEAGLVKEGDASRGGIDTRRSAALV